MKLKHTVRTGDRGTKTFSNYTRGFAIKAMCSECEGFEGNPRDCTATKCPLYPYRRITLATRIGDK